MDKKAFYKTIRSLLDSNSKAVLRELPDTFTLSQFLGKVRLIFPPEYGKAILQFGGEKKLISWVYQYYLLRRPKIIKRQRPIHYDGFCVNLTPDSILEGVWLKVKSNLC